MKPAAWLFGLLALPLAASNPAVQVADINTQVMGSVVGDFTLFRWPAEIVAGDSQIWFTADDGVHGLEVWKSDGTAAGTRPLADICPGACPSASHELTVAGSRLYFAANDGVHGLELWVAEDGAIPTVIDLEPGLEGTNPQYLHPLGSQVFFSAHTAAEGAELWVSDGTPGGTRRVLDLRPGPEGSTPRSLGHLGARMLFVGNDGIHGQELWATDGTAAGTQLVRDLNPGAIGSIQPTFNFLLAGGGQLGTKILFAADDGTHGTELWVTDGSASGTTLLADLWPGPGASYPEGFTAFGQRLVFVGKAVGGNRHAWVSDGTPEGTSMLTEDAGSESIDVALPLAPAGSRLYFRRHDAAGSELWVTDGTREGTHQVEDIYPGPSSGLGTERWGWFSPLVDGRLLFHANDGEHGAEPWVSDGTPEGTYLLSDLRAGAPASFEPIDYNFAWRRASLGSVGFFFAETAADRWLLWRSDGTEAGTFPFIELNRQTSSIDPLYPTGFGERENLAARPGGGLFFTASDNGLRLARALGVPSGPPDLPPQTTGQELWVTDGTTAGTRLIADLQPGTAGASPRQIQSLAPNDAYFAATTELQNEDLWRTDGTPGGTRRILTLSGSGLVASSAVASSGRIGHHALYGFYGDVRGRLCVVEEDRTDVFDTGLQSPAFFYRSADQVYFVGDGLWVTDGTRAGTQRLAPIGASAIAQVGRRALFWGRLAAETEPWISDGTLEGTAALMDLWPGSGSGYSPDVLSRIYRQPLAAGTQFHFYFAADNGTHGEELWVSDGTAPGTFQPLDIFPGSRGSEPRWLTAVENRVYFVADDGVHGREPWVSDGTVAGTRLVADLNPGPASSVAEEFLALGERVVFSASDGRLGRELWISGGEPTTTLRVADIHPGAGSSSPTLLTLSGSALYFAATDGVTGFELWKVPVEKLPEPQLFADGFESGNTAAWSVVSP